MLNIAFPPGLPPRWKQRQSSRSERERPPARAERLSCLLRPVVGLRERPTLMEGLLLVGCVGGIAPRPGAQLLLGSRGLEALPSP